MIYVIVRGTEDTKNRFNPDYEIDTTRQCFKDLEVACSTVYSMNLALARIGYNFGINNIHIDPHDEEAVQYFANEITDNSPDFKKVPIGYYAVKKMALR